MGLNVERLERLKLNQANWAAVTVRTSQLMQRAAAVESTGEASDGVQKAARTEGFQGDLGDLIREKLIKIHGDLLDFTEYQAKLNSVIGAANEALRSAATEMDGLPSVGLTSYQQATVDKAIDTNSPVQVSPGVMMTPAQAKQYYQDQADAEQEEAARRMTLALDQRLQEIIDGMPRSKYDPEKPEDELSNNGGIDGSGTNDRPYRNRDDSTVSGDDGTNNTGNYDGPRVVRPDDRHDNHGDPEPPTYVVDPPKVFDPPYEPPFDPPYDPNRPDGPPNVDGDNDGRIPGGPGGPGGSGGPRLPNPGGTIPGGGVSPGGVGALGGGAVGGVGGAALAGGLGRAGGIGAVGGLNGMGGSAGGPGVTGVVAQSSGAGGRAGMLAGGGAAGGGGAGKRKRRRGQDLVAFEVDPEDDGIAPDLGAAGAAGSSASDGREELGW